MAERDTTLYPKEQDLLKKEMDKRLKEAGRQGKIQAIENFLVRNIQPNTPANFTAKRKK